MSHHDHRILVDHHPETNAFADFYHLGSRHVALSTLLELQLCSADYICIDRWYVPLNGKLDGVCVMCIHCGMPQIQACGALNGLLESHFLLIW